MAAPAAMQRKPIRLTAVKAVAIGIGRSLGLRLRRCLTAGDERRQPVDIRVARRRLHVLLARLKMLRLRLGLRLLVLLARIERLRLARRKRLATHRRLLVVAFIEGIVRHVAAHVALLLLLIERLALAKLFLGGGDHAEIMFGVLVIVFGGDRVAGALRIAGELKIFFRNVGRGAPNFHVRSVGLVHARQRILVMTTLAVATPHALVLTVSHGLLFCQPPLCAAAWMPPFLTKNSVTIKLRRKRALAQAPHSYHRH